MEVPAKPPHKSLLTFCQDEAGTLFQSDIADMGENDDALLASMQSTAASGSGEAPAPAVLSTSGVMSFK